MYLFKILFQFMEKEKVFKNFEKQTNQTKLFLINFKWY